jgi:hypothetical protein
VGLGLLLLSEFKPQEEFPPKQNRTAMLGLVLLLIANVACIHKVGGQPTPYEKAVTYSDMLAQTNNSIAKGVIQAQELKLLSITQANRILSAQERIAMNHQALSKILDLGPKVATTRADELRAILGGIKASLLQLDFERDGLGIKNPTSEQTFANDTNAISSFADVILSSLTAAGVLK